MSTENTSIGHRTSGAEGTSPDHESMQETGGSGTAPDPFERGASTVRSEQRAGGMRQGAAEDADEAEGAGTAATATARGFQDTRSRQSGPGETGLGTPETGGNQSERDLAPPRD